MSEPRFVTTRTAAPGRAAASEQDVLLASSLLNTAEQVGGSTGLAVLGTVAWTVVATPPNPFDVTRRRPCRNRQDR